MSHIEIPDRDGDYVVVEPTADGACVLLSLPSDDGEGGQFRALTLDQCASLIGALTRIAKEIGK